MAKPELAADHLPEPTRLEVLAHRRAHSRFPEVALVEHRGLVEDLVEPLAAPSRRLELGRHLLVLELHPEALHGEPFHGAGEVQLLGLADELDQVAAGATQPKQ